MTRTNLAVALADLGAVGRSIMSLAVPAGERVDALPPSPQAQAAQTYNIVVNIIPTPEESPWPIQ